MFKKLPPDYNFNGSSAAVSQPSSLTDTPELNQAQMSTLTPELMQLFQNWPEDEEEYIGWFSGELSNGYVIYNRSENEFTSNRFERLTSFAVSMGPYFAPFVPQCYELAKDTFGAASNPGLVVPVSESADLLASCIEVLCPLYEESVFSPLNQTPETDNQSQTAVSLPPLPALSAPPPEYHPIYRLSE